MSKKYLSQWDKIKYTEDKVNKVVDKVHKMLVLGLPDLWEWEKA